MEPPHCRATAHLPRAPGEALLYMTEEALKPLLNLRGLVMLGSAGTLATLRALGFQTFAGVVNESYDEVLDAPTRISAALAEAYRNAPCRSSACWLQRRRG